ncbi:MAG: dipeptide ABC transporter ATP-binding protein [Dermatophilaceae bacterium]|nr:dipeptide ABC transporter ATP-binding protein [Dermatophilaceae bacterium]NUQ32482.1 dipeptide ABC transporter ATP-binding protein [Dermatophilaceae bacterium]NUR16803.1 dipeptide ABC transporter ATP-binding protein [Dermatophilaceae bacterium]
MTDLPTSGRTPDDEPAAASTSTATSTPSSAPTSTPTSTPTATPPSAHDASRDRTSGASGGRRFSRRRKAADDDVALGEVILEVTDLKKHFPMHTSGIIRRAADPVKAVDGISFSVRKGETLGLVGESGCGKSTAGRTLLQLLQPTSGSIRYKGKDVTNADPKELRKLRNEMQMVFQDPYGSLNPRQTVGTIIAAPFHIQGIKPEGGIKAEVQRLMERVGLNPEHYNRFPHEFSGGQRQRIGIARAVALRPKVIVCDEPVSALDVSIQAQVVNLLEDLQDEFELTYVFVAHDLAVIRHISDRVAVMYLGKIMELATRDELYENPLHPYTQALLSAVPIPDPRRENKRERILLKGDLPSPINPPSGCVFHTRCPRYREDLSEAERTRCTTEVPVIQGEEDHRVACHFAGPPKVDVI